MSEDSQYWEIENKTEGQGFGVSQDEDGTVWLVAWHDGYAVDRMEQPLTRAEADALRRTLEAMLEGEG